MKSILLHKSGRLRRIKKTTNKNYFIYIEKIFLAILINTHTAAFSACPKQCPGPLSLASIENRFIKNNDLQHCHDEQAAS
ncbi:hypothetical protein [Duganella sp. P38]|uniref:hypothetical protein n=1 Tax=Duganella sp. P38 TaxID=3423949 RepID=UPI003D7A8CEB